MANVVEILVTSRNLATPGFAAASASARSLSGTMHQMSAVSTVALAAIAVESVKMASSYQSSTTRLVTSAGESVKNIDLVRKGMLDMAGQVGVSANDLSKSMYYVEAAGYHAADGLTVLKAAAEGAAAEGADTTTVAKALTDILVDYHLKASEAADITSKMVEAVAHGKVNLQDFSKAFASIVPAASAAGISFTDVMAALSQMTNHGFTATRASMNLAQALRSLLNPTKPMKTAFADFGVTTEELAKKLHGANGLTDAMEYLAKAAGKAGKEGTPEFAAALRRLMGTAPGANAALTTVAANFDATNKTIKDIGGATSDADGKVKGFALVQKSLGQQTKQLTAGFESLMIELGQRLIPVVTSVVVWMSKHHTIVMDTIKALGILMAAFIVYSATVKTVAAVTTIWAGIQAILNGEMTANPIGIIVVAIAALVIGIIEAYKHSKTFRDIIHDIGEGAKIAFQAVVNAGEAAFNWIKDHWKLLVAILGGPIGAAVILIIDNFDTIKSVVEKTVGWIRDHWKLLVAIIFGPVGLAVDAIVTHFGFLEKVTGDVIKWITKQWDSIYHALSGPVKSAVTAIEMLFGVVRRAVGSALRWISRTWDSIAHALSGPVKLGVAAIAAVLRGLMSYIVATAKWIWGVWTGLEGILVWPFKAAWSVISGILDQVRSAVSSVTHMGGSVVSGVSKFFGFAHGGTVGAAATGGVRSGLTLVGEQGPELVHLPAGSHVMSNPDTQRAMSAGGGGSSEPIVVILQMDGHEMSRALINPMRRTIKHINGGNVQAVLGS